MSLLLLSIVFALILSGSREDCPCQGHTVCVSGQCKAINDGTVSCTSISDCADSTSWGVCSGTCQCASGHKWNYYYNQCLIPNDGSGSCSSSSACFDQSPYGGCRSGKCKCDDDSCSLGSGEIMCCSKNDGHSCSGSASNKNYYCFDYFNGYCSSSSKCVCNTNFIWEDSQQMCKGLNSGGAACTALVQCYDRSDRALCDGTCKCQSDCSYSSNTCLAPCSGVYTCGSDSQCISTSHGGCNGGYCSCDPNYHPKGSQCLAYNNGGGCSGPGECYDQTAGRTSCQSGSCVCTNGAVWHSTRLLCLMPNDGTKACSSVNDCYDITSGTTLCNPSFKCDCATGYAWVAGSMRCLGKNIGISCGSVSDCVDQLAGVCSGSQCLCKTYNVWVDAAKQCKCQPGAYSSTGRNDCALCSAGTYQWDTGTTGCISCSAGTSNPNQGSTVATACSDCGIGKYSSSAGASTCTTCSAGSYAPGPQSTSCTQCTAGMYQDQPGLGSCNDCGAGKASSSSGATACTVCTAGMYAPGPRSTSCSQCLAGTYQDLTGQGSCKDCGVGMVSSAHAAICIVCSAGAYAPGPQSVSCTSCSAGTYQDLSGQGVCKDCGTGMISTLGAAGCTACSAGSYAVGPQSTSCTQCTAGTYQDLIAQGNCKDCGVGKASSAGASACNVCPAGAYAVGPQSAVCILCLAGTYQDLIGQGDCKDCGTGKISSAGVASCSACSAGTYATGPRSTSCSQCAAGTYQDQVGQGTCKDCGVGKVSSAGASSCTTCLAGTYATGPQSTVCTPCSAGTYQDQPGKGGCVDCGIGKVSSSGAAICTICSAGSYAPGPQSISCTPCEKGRYQDQAGKDSCINCGAGTYDPNTGSATAAACMPCPAGKYNTAAGREDCDLCDYGTAKGLASTSTCDNCIPGTYADLKGMTACLPCPKGKATNLNSQQYCQDCSAGMYQSATGQTVCLNCQKGQSQPDPGKDSCIDCVAGKYADVEGLLSCKPCSAGMYQPSTGQDSCSVCPVGSYQTAVGQGHCILCAAGTYNALTSQSLSSACLSCPCGTYAPATGTSSCTSCSPGTFNPALGGSASGACQNCLANTYCPNYATCACTACPLRSVSTAGSTVCSCVTGAYYDPSQPVEYCPPCYDLCTACSGNAHGCSACATNAVLVGGVEGCHCPTENGYYLTLNAGKLECKPCHRLCLTCDGPTRNDCLSCRSAEVANIAPLSGKTCNCNIGYFDDSTKLVPVTYCQPCYRYCSECDVVYDNCQSCINNEGVKYEGNHCKCTASGYFEYYNAVSMTYSCVTCSPLCSACYGPSNTQCTTCRTDIGAIMVPPNTCVCANGYFYDTASSACQPCNSLCATCFGPTANECNSCNLALAYSFEGSSNLCASDCYGSPGRYVLGRVCMKCDPKCRDCLGPNSTYCLSCTDSSLVSYKGDCLDGCPSHYYASEGSCYECHPRCLECLNGTKTGCTSCSSGYYQWNSECVTTCPAGTYISAIAGKALCISCESPCQTCTSQTGCLTCAPGYYYRSDQACVLGGECFEGTYPEPASRTCADCDPSCLTCSGPRNKDCILCNFVRGYSRGTGDSGECYPLICEEGKFVSKNYTARTASCAACDHSCRTCDGPGPENCIECTKDRTAYATETPNRVMCKSCEEVNPGLSTGSDGSCQEVCGDGKNMGHVECDDGNRLNGDGCDANCKVEEGFECHTPKEGGADVCVDMTAPSGELSFASASELYVSFSERVFPSVNSSTLGATMELVLQGSTQCNFTWKLASVFPANTAITGLSLHLNLPCSLADDMFVLRFTVPAIIPDQAGNQLSTNTLRTPTGRYRYVSDTEQAVVSGTGQAFSAVSFATFAMAISMCLFQSAAVGSFWSFVNMLQILSYLPIINCDLPYNFEVFLTQYLSVSQVVFPFQMLPGFVPNPLSYLTAFLTDPLSDRYSLCGYSTLSFIYNFGSQLVTWLLLFLFYILLLILDRVLPTGRCTIVRQWREDYECNAVIRALIECFLSMAFCSFLNIWQLNTSTTMNKISLGGAGLAAYLCCGFLVAVLRLVETPTGEMAKEEFKKRYGTVVEDLRMDGPVLCLYFYPLYIVRRLVYACILIVFGGYPMLQLYATVIFVLVPMLIYLIVYKPFDNRLNNCINIYNELVLLAAFGATIVTNTRQFSDMTCSIVGWVLIPLVLASLVVIWATMFPPAVVSLVRTIRDWLTGKSKEKSPAEEQKKEIEAEEEPRKEIEAAEEEVSPAGRRVKVVPSGWAQAAEGGWQQRSSSRGLRNLAEANGNSPKVLIRRKQRKVSKNAIFPEPLAQ